MKKLLFILTIVLIYGFTPTLDTKPTDAKSLQTPNNVTFYYHPTDTSLGVNMSGIGYLRMIGVRKIQFKIDSLALHMADTLQYYRLLTNHDSLSRLQEKDYASLDNKPDLTLKANVTDPTFLTKITTPVLKVTTGAAEGYVLKTHADGTVYSDPLTASQIYKGTWNATSNTPTLIDGTGTSGWWYRVTVAGTWNSIAFNVGDDISYNGTVWQRIPAQTITGNALTATNDVNVTLTPTGSHETSLLNAAGLTVGWTGTLADSRIASAATWNAKVSGTGTVGYVPKFTGVSGLGNSLVYQNGLNIVMGSTTPVSIAGLLTTLTLGGTNTTISGGIAYQTNGVLKGVHYVENNSLTHQSITGGHIFLCNNIEKVRFDATGAATFASTVQSTKYTSIVATGTQPYSTTSTTLNTNLNADLLDGWHASSFLQSADITGKKDISDSTAIAGYTRRDRLASQIATRVAKNTAITGATKTKITYDSKGLVTSGSDATTTDIAEGTRLYYTDNRADSRVVAGITTKVDKVTGKSLVLDTEIAKIHVIGSDNQYVSGVTDIHSVGGSNLYTFFSSAALPANAPVAGSSYVQGIQFPLVGDLTYRQLLVSNNGNLYYGNENNNVWQLWRKIWDSGNFDPATKQPLSTVLTNTTAAFTTAQETKLTGIASGAEVNVNADWNAISGDAQILNKPTLFSGVYNDLSGKPTIPAAQIQSDWNQATVGALDYIKNKPTIPTQYTDAMADTRVVAGITGKQNTITLTTTGTSGAATLVGSTLNIPLYSGGSGATDLSISGTSSPLTLNSSTGNDVTITAGTGINLTGTSGNMTIVNSLPDTYSAVTKGNLTENITGLEFDATRQVIGGASQLSLTAGYGIPTNTEINNGNTAFGWGNHAGLYVPIANAGKVLMTGGSSYSTMNTSHFYSSSNQIYLNYGLLNDINSIAPAREGAVVSALDAKQATLYSGTNIKTVGGLTLLGSGNIDLVPNGSITPAKIADYNSPSQGNMLSYDATYGFVWSEPITGTGTSGRVTYWNGSRSITSDADFTFDGIDLRVGATNGTGNVHTGDFIRTSDKRIKCNIKPITFSNVDKIKFVQYNLKADSTHRTHYGVIAQQVEKYMPEAVYTDKTTGMKSVNYDDILIAKIVELENRIKALESEKLNPINDEK